jgi:methionyl-tRNA synthetase
MNLSQIASVSGVIESSSEGWLASNAGAIVEVASEAAEASGSSFFAFLLENPLVVIAVVIWIYAWKGLGLWRAARKNDLIWFMAMLLVNTMGLLEITYILYLEKVDWQKVRTKVLGFLGMTQKERVGTGKK